MMHPKQVINNKRGHACSTNSDQPGDCPCGPVSKRPANNGGEGGEETLADSLFSLVTAAEQQRQAQERSSDSYTPTGGHWNPLSCSAPPALSSRQTIFPPAGNYSYLIYLFNLSLRKMFILLLYFNCMKIWLDFSHHTVSLPLQSVVTSPIQTLNSSKIYSNKKYQ